MMDKLGLYIRVAPPTFLLLVAMAFSACTPPAKSTSTGETPSRAMRDEASEAMDILLSPEFVERVQQEGPITLEVEFPQTAYERELTKRGLVVENKGRLVGDLFSLDESDLFYRSIYDMDGIEYGASNTSEYKGERGYLTAAVRKEGNLIMKVVFEWYRWE